MPTPDTKHPASAEETTPRQIADALMDTLPSWKGSTTYDWRISYSGREFRDRIEEALRAANQRANEAVAARATANNQWRLDYNKLAVERDTQYARAETAERERDGLRALLIDVKAFHDRDQGHHGFGAEYEHLRLRLAEALAGEGGDVSEVTPALEKAHKENAELRIGVLRLQSALVETGMRLEKRPNRPQWIAGILTIIDHALSTTEHLPWPASRVSKKGET